MITASTTCSGSALESTIIALTPPVSAISGMVEHFAPSGPWASDCAIVWATAVDPVNTTPAVRACATSAAPTVSPRPAHSTRTLSGMPASYNRFTIAIAIPGVCSAGLAATALPVTRAAAICPVKIASGKFHGDMQTHTPRPRKRSSFDSPVGPGNCNGVITRSTSWA